MSGGLDGWFRLRERGTDVRTEVRAGVTTFMVMAYIFAIPLGGPLETTGRAQAAPARGTAEALARQP